MDTNDPAQTLRDAAYTLAEEIRDGKWRHVEDAGNMPETSNPAIIDELRRRCPGHSPPQYRQALAQGLFDSR